MKQNRRYLYTWNVRVHWSCIISASKLVGRQSVIDNLDLNLLSCTSKDLQFHLSMWREWASFYAAVVLCRVGLCERGLGWVRDEVRGFERRRTSPRGTAWGHDVRVAAVDQMRFCSPAPVLSAVLVRTPPVPCLALRHKHKQAHYLPQIVSLSAPASHGS